MGMFWQCDDGKRFYIGIGESPHNALSKAVTYSNDGDSHEVTLWERRRLNMYVGPPVWGKPRYLGRVLLADDTFTLDERGAGREMTQTHPDDVPHVWV